MMMRSTQYPAGLLGLLVAGGCSSTLPNTACNSTAPLAVTVDVQDALTGTSLAESATGTIQNETTLVVDTLHYYPGGIYSGPELAGGRNRGTYDLRIEHPGYRLWTKSQIHVTQLGDCGQTLPVHVDARLDRAP